MRQSISKSKPLRFATSFCYLCGLRIPEDIANPSHALYGTTDHVIPTSRNGAENWRNRAPAHRRCNEAKADRLIASPVAFAERRHQELVPLLDRVGHHVSHRERGQALQRVLKRWPLYLPEKETVGLDRWEDDGGSIWHSLRLRQRDA